MEVVCVVLNCGPMFEESMELINKAYEDSKDENGESQYYYPDYTIRVLEELLEKRK